MFIAALFTTDNKWKPTKCPLTGEWFKYEICTLWLKLETTISEINQSQKEKYWMIPYI